MLSSIRSTFGRKKNVAVLRFLHPKPANLNHSAQIYTALRSVPKATTSRSFSTMQTRLFTVSGTIEHTAINNSTLSALKNFPTSNKKSSTEMMDIYVGPHSQHFRVHKKVLCRRIPYFNNTIENSIEFPDEGPESFYALLLWVYTEKLPVVSKSEKVKVQSPWNLLKVYSLAQKLASPELISYVTSQWIEQARGQSNAQCPNFELLDEIYSTLPAESRPHEYISWVFYSLSRLNSENGLAVGEVWKLMKKHPDLKADLVQYIEKEKAWYEREKLRASQIQEIKKTDKATGKDEEDEHDSGIDHRSCTEAFAG
ncbi:hypothetical protein L207DRAFT_523072 [Hyaloscypha variabilis F]|uniref:BTB domain-containing protein n=1 Tax=Hyaloscypha variabilis (strain UAMH 11265 / GT02V1 / F) TaxID=1149755 RepID=A0A2J6SAB2_HYAVF|nr:hypothetical protein L207DRAFT_523072 [Hyaloscypha variabilis F]